MPNVGYLLSSGGSVKAIGYGCHNCGLLRLGIIDGLDLGMLPFQLAHMLAQFLELRLIEWRPSAGQESRWPLQCRLAKRVADFPVGVRRKFGAGLLSHCFKVDLALFRVEKSPSREFGFERHPLPAEGSRHSLVHLPPHALVGPAPLLGMFCTEPFEMCLHAWIVLRHEARQNLDFICHTPLPRQNTHNGKIARQWKRRVSLSSRPTRRP